MNHWTSVPMTRHGFALPSFDNFEDADPLSFESHFDDSFDETSWDDHRGMTLGEFYDRIQDAQDADFAPLIPLLVSALPSVIQGVSSVVQSFSRPRGGSQQAPPPPAPPRNNTQAPPSPPRPRFLQRPTPPTAQPQVQVPTPAQVPQPASVTNNSTPSSAANNSTLTTLLALLSSPALQSSIQSATGGAAIPAGNSQIPVSAVMDIIGQLAGDLSGNYNPPAQESYPDFLFDSFGNALVNIESADAVGTLLLQRLQNG